MATTITVGTGAGGVGTALVNIVYAKSSPTLGSGLHTTPIQQNANSPMAESLLDLALGDTTVAIPTTAAGVIIVPPTANAQVLKLKGAGADTGITISPRAPTMLSFANPPPASFIINAGGVVVGTTFMFY